MTTPQAPLPKRRPLRTREELLQAGHQRAGDMRSAPEPAERLAALLMLAFPAKSGGTGPLDTSASKDGPASWLKPGSACCFAMVARVPAFRRSVSFSAVCGTPRATLPKTVAVVPRRRSGHLFRLR